MGKDIDSVINSTRTDFMFEPKGVNLWNFINSIKLKVSHSPLKIKAGEKKTSEKDKEPVRIDKDAQEGRL